MLRPFNVICSKTAAATLSRDECHRILQSVLPLAEQRDRGNHEGMALAFDMHGKE